MVDYENRETLRRRGRHPTIGMYTFFLAPAVIAAICAVVAYAGDVNDATSAEKVSSAVNAPSNETQDEPRALDPLQRRVRRFCMQNIPLHYAVEALNKLGVRICIEWIREEQFDGYVDRDGVGVFAADRLISLDLHNVEVPRILDSIVVRHPLYRWVRVPGTPLINLIPKESRLDLPVGPAHITGNAWEILNKLPFPGSDRLRYGVFRGGHLPKITLNVPRCSARQFLNTLVMQYPGLIWRAYGDRGVLNVTFSSISEPYVDEVVVVFPDVRKGTATNTSLRYELKEREEQGVLTLVVEKQPGGW